MAKKIKQDSILEALKNLAIMINLLLGSEYDKISLNF